MGLVLYAILFFLGARGVRVRAGLAYCLATAALLMPFSLAAIDDMPSCDGVGCDYSAPTLALIGLTQAILALASYGAGVGARRLSSLIRK